MMSNILSQEEIDALLRGTTDVGDNAALNSVEIDALGELANISMGTAATTLSSLLSRKVEITTPHVELIKRDTLRDVYPKPFVLVSVNYTMGLIGSNIFVINTFDAGIIVDLMMGGNGTGLKEDLNEIHMSALGEAMNQMMGTASTSLSAILNKRIDITPPSMDIVNLKEHPINKDINSMSDDLVKVSFKLVIQGLVDSEMVQLLPIDFAKQLVSDMFSNSEYSVDDNSHDVAVINTNHEVPSYPTKIEDDFRREEKVKVQPIAFQPLSRDDDNKKDSPNLSLILDVSLQLSVELGRTNMKIKDILDLSEGSIVELDKLAGEPVDLLVNGKLLAKGEVVVIDENFGVRITEIISPVERVKNLQ